MCMLCRGVGEGGVIRNAVHVGFLNLDIPESYLSPL